MATASRDKVVQCAAKQLPRHEACIRRVLDEGAACRSAYAFHAGIWCLKNHPPVLPPSASELEKWREQCLGVPLASDRCAEAVARAMHQDGLNRCEKGLRFGGVWQPPEKFSQCVGEQKCCNDPEAKAAATCGAAAKSAVERCGSE